MSCLRPLTIRNPRYKKMSNSQLINYCVKTIGTDYCYWNRFDRSIPLGWIPPDYYLNVPCGKCPECLKAKRLSWSHRLIVELMSHPQSTYLTLTLDDDSLLRFQDDPKKPIKLYIDRLRKAVGFRPKYFIVSEFGDTGRLHYHGFFFGTDVKSMPYKVQRDLWKYGHVWLAPTPSAKLANYVVKYLFKQYGDKKSIMMCSNGIGASYVTNVNRAIYINYMAFNPYVRLGRSFYPLHRYYVDKFLTDDLRLCKMLNRDDSFKCLTFQKKKYDNPILWNRARQEWYNSIKHLEENGNFHNSQTRTRQNRFIESISSQAVCNQFFAGLALPSFNDGYSSW